MRTSLMRMSLLTPALLALLISTSVLAQSTKSPRDEKGPISLSLGEITIDPNATRINKRQPILFKPLEMVDPATGKSVSPDYPIKLPSGKQITAGEYYAKVNEIERHLNEQGYSLRDKNTVFVQEVAIDEGLLSKQKKTAEAAHTKTDISPDRLFKQFGTDAVISGEAFRVDLAAAGINVKQAADMALEVKKIGLDMPTNRLIADPRTLATLAEKAGKIVNLDPKPLPIPEGTPRPFVPVGTSNSWTSNDIGDPSKFAVNMTGRLDVSGEARRVLDVRNPQNDLRNFAVRTDVRATGTMQNQPLDLLRATGSIEDDASSHTAHARMLVSVAGRDVYTFDQALPDSWQFNDSLPTQTLDYHYHTSIAIIWGIQVGVTVGVRGEAGCRYNLSLLPTQMSGRVEPYVHSNGYAQSDVNFVDIAGVGAGSDIVVLNDDMTLAGDVTLGWLGGWYLQARAQGYNRLHALDGRMYVYAFLGPRDHPLWRGEYEYWRWPGVSGEGRMFTPYNQIVALH